MMKYTALIMMSLMFFTSTIYAGNSSAKDNDTLYFENEIRIFYKANNRVDSVHIVDKKFTLKERGFIKNNLIKFYDINNQLTAVGGFNNNNLDGNFAFFKNGTLYKTVNLKNGKEDGIALVFDEHGYLDQLYESVDGKVGGLSVVFENHLPKYLRTAPFTSDAVILSEFSSAGKLKSLEFSNDDSSELEAEIKKAIPEK